MKQRKWYDAIRKYSHQYLPVLLETELEQYIQEPEYKEFSDALDAICEKHPIVITVTEHQMPCQLNEEEVDALREYLEVKADIQQLITDWYLGEILRLRCLLMTKE